MISLLNSFTSTLTSIGYILIAIAFLMVMITIHELGHYVAGKIFKFKINEFSIGFGKAIYQRTNEKTGEKFSIRIFPLGGYCAFEGEDENSETKGSFNSMAWWKRLIVLFNGAFFNFLSAIFISIFVIMFIGDGTTKITEVYTFDNYNNPNYSIVESVDYLQEGDIILKVNGRKPTFLNGGIKGIDEDDTTANLVVLRNGEELKITITKFICPDYIDENGNPVVNDFGKIETSMKFGINQEYVRFGFGEAVLKCIPFTLTMAWECLLLIFQLFTGQLSLRNAGGTITTISAVANATKQNFLNLLLFFPVIAVNLAVFNWLPLPALDGGRMLFVIIEAIRRKPIDRKLEGKIHTIGLLVLFAFVILIDILQLFVFKGV